MTKVKLFILGLIAFINLSFAQEQCSLADNIDAYLIRRAPIENYVGPMNKFTFRFKDNNSKVNFDFEGNLYKDKVEFAKNCVDNTSTLGTDKVTAKKITTKTICYPAPGQWQDMYIIQIYNTNLKRLITWREYTGSTSSESYADWLDNPVSNPIRIDWSPLDVDFIHMKNNVELSRKKLFFVKRDDSFAYNQILDSYLTGSDRWDKDKQKLRSILLDKSYQTILQSFYNDKLLMDALDSCYSHIYSSAVHHLQYKHMESIKNK